ncbi:MAG: ThiF family adenylyltransferase [Pyrinomonadaceae bacterium]|nr:ThiF family adenylyltransferase [Phycisphaerales bacterium]
MPHPRYHRQMLLPDIGESGQQRLAESHALLIGCGALGCGIADLLVRAGVGTLTIVDRDVVELTNLQRQSLFDERDARDATPKAEAAAARLRRVNSLVRIIPLVMDFSSAVAEDIFDSHHVSIHTPSTAPTPPVNVIVDGTDNFAARYLMNDLAVKRAIPFIYGGAVATGGMTMTILPRVSPCLRCVFPDSPGVGISMTCDTAGILGPVAAVVSAMQAAEAIKAMLGKTQHCSTHLVEIDLWANAHRRVNLASARDPHCPCCVQHRFEFLDGLHESDASVICTRIGGGAVQIQPRRHCSQSPPAHRIDLASIAQRLAPHGTFLATSHVLRGNLATTSPDESEPIELTIFADGRAIIRGTMEVGVAKAIYARYVGE